MCLQPNEEIGMEVHPENDQFFRFEAGEGKVYIDDNVYDVKDGSVCIVPA
jgi:mannose-6-phosphate isomerase-like protein (cupin superfamily)